MAEKPDAKAKDKDAPGAAAAPDKSGSSPAETPAQAKAKGGALKAWLPAILAIVVAPATSWAVAEFVLLPKLQAKLAAVAAEGEGPHAGPGDKKSSPHGEKEKKPEAHGEKK